MNLRLNPDYFYVNGVAIPASYFQGLDTAQTQAVDGDTGGTWNPSSPIYVGGAGIGLSGASLISGGSLIQTPVGSGVRVTLAANDAIKLNASNAAASRTVRTSGGRFVDASSGASQPVQLDVATGGAKCFGAGSRFLLPLRVHDGATLVGLAMTAIIVGPSNRTLPASQPLLRVYTLDVFGNITPLLASTPPGGWLQFAVAQASYGAHTVALTYTFTTPAVISASTLAYVAEVSDESGNNSVPGNIYTDFGCAFVNIPDLRAD